MTLEVKSPDFASGGTIPKRFTCEGADLSPALEWSAPPSGTQSFALIADDPDAPAGTWVHWVVFDLPPGLRSLPQAVPKNEQLADGSRQGQNDFGKTGYGGPCPPPGKAHRYFFKLYALDTRARCRITCSPKASTSGATRADSPGAPFDLRFSRFTALRGSLSAP